MSFDLLARHYRWMEWLLAGKKLQRCRVAFLPQIKSPSRILLMGEGHGRFLEICRKQFPLARITVVDASARMLEMARRQCAASSIEGIQFVHCDCLHWEPGAEKFDLIATHFFLDCFTPLQLESVIPKLAKTLDEDGVWLVTDFRVPNDGWRRARAKIIHALMYFFFRRVTGISSHCVTAPDRYLALAGLRLDQRQEWDWGLLHADLWRKVG